MVAVSMLTRIHVLFVLYHTHVQCNALDSFREQLTSSRSIDINVVPA